MTWSLRDLLLTMLALLGPLLIFWALLVWRIRRRGDAPGARSREDRPPRRA